MPKLIFSANLRNTIRTNILKFPVISARAFPRIQDSVHEGYQELKWLYLYFYSIWINCVTIYTLVASAGFLCNLIITVNIYWKLLILLYKFKIIWWPNSKIWRKCRKTRKRSRPFSVTWFDFPEKVNVFILACRVSK